MLVETEAAEAFDVSAEVEAVAWLAACLADDLVILEDMSNQVWLMMWHETAGEGKGSRWM